MIAIIIERIVVPAEHVLHYSIGKCLIATSEFGWQKINEPIRAKARSMLPKDNLRQICLKMQLYR